RPEYDCDARRHRVGFLRPQVLPIRGETHGSVPLRGLQLPEPSELGYSRTDPDFTNLRQDPFNAHQHARDPDGAEVYVLSAPRFGHARAQSGQWLLQTIQASHFRQPSLQRQHCVNLIKVPSDNIDYSDTRHAPRLFFSCQPNTNLTSLIYYYTLMPRLH